ncbi:MAG: hypothetical protein ABSA58_15750, partial [Acetobacteraceae bacterium]
MSEQLTDAHYDWAGAFCGIPNIRGTSGVANGPGVPEGVPPSASSASAAAPSQTNGGAAGMAQTSARPIPVPSVDTKDKAALVASMQMVDSIKTTDGGGFTIEATGGIQPITEQQANDLRAKAAAALKDALQRVSNRADMAMGRYSAQQKINLDSPISAFGADLMAKAKAALSGGHYEDPGPRLYPLSAKVTNCISQARSAVGGGKFSDAAGALADAEEAAAQIAGMVQAYCDGIIGGAESNVAVLEVTKTVCFAIDGVIAIVITGGGAAALAEGVGASGVGGSAATAGAIANFAPVVASGGTYALQVAEGDPVDWKKATADMVIQLVLAKFGGKMTEGLTSLVGRLGGSSLSSEVVRKIIVAEIMQAGSSCLQTVVSFAISKQEGKKVTWGQLMSAIEAAVLDPKGIVAAAALGAVSAKYPTTPGAQTTPAPEGGTDPVTGAPSGPNAGGGKAEPNASTPTAPPAGGGTEPVTSAPAGPNAGGGTVEPNVSPPAAPPAGGGTAPAASASADPNAGGGPVDQNVSTPAAAPAGGGTEPVASAPADPNTGGEPPEGPPDLTPEQQRQVEILQEFEERQIHHGSQQMGADEAPAPNLDEHGRIPELTQGPEPETRFAKLGDTKFSQANVSPVMGDGTPLKEVEQNMADHGPDPGRPDADMVANEDGSLTSIDNRRLVAAHGADLDGVPAQVHAADEPLPEEMA